MTIPELRFKADDGSEFPDWEGKKLGDNVKFINGRAYSQDELLSVGKYQVLRVGNLFTNDTYYYSDMELEPDKYIEDGDLIYAWSATFGPRIYIGNKCIYHYHIWKLKFDENIVSKTFLNYILERDVEKIMSQRTGGTMVHITKSAMENRELFFPSLPEQKKIASFLSTIDDIITTTEAELTAWQERKKGVMQKIFNREVRFKADDGSEFPEWEEKRLGEVTSRVTRRNNNMISDISLTISGVYGLIDQRKYFNKIVAASDLSNYYLLKSGEFAYNRSSSVGYDFGAIKRLDSCECGAVSTLYVCFSILDENDVCSDYLRMYFDSNIWNKYAASVCAEGARNHGLLNISVNDFFDMPVFIPSLPEQKRIAECLSAIDEVITLTKKELSAWKEFKKGLLQQMFV